MGHRRERSEHHDPDLSGQEPGRGAELAPRVVNCEELQFPRTSLWVSIEVGVSYDSDLDQVERVTMEVAQAVLQEIDGGISTEDPVVVFHTFADSSINLETRMMVREIRSQAPIRHEFIKRLHKRYNAEGIEIPYPIRTVVMQRDG